MNCLTCCALCCEVGWFQSHTTWFYLKLQLEAVGDAWITYLLKGKRETIQSTSCAQLKPWVCVCLCVCVCGCVSVWERECVCTKVNVGGGMCAYLYMWREINVCWDLNLDHWEQITTAKHHTHKYVLLNLLKKYAYSWCIV